MPPTIVANPKILDPVAPALMHELTWRDRARREANLWKRQLLCASRALAGRARTTPPLLVFTTSRSGSTWFCELLSGIKQCATLPEHLRPLHFQYALRASASEEVLQNYLKQASKLIHSGRDGGSKLIWDYFPELIPRIGIGSPCSILAPLIELSPFCLRLRRRDRISQAVSRYRSAQTGAYHNRRQPRLYPFAQQHPQQPVTVGTFDRAAIAHHDDILRRAEDHLDWFLEGLGTRVYEITYEELVADPSAVLLPIAARLRQDMSPSAQRLCVKRTLDRARIIKGEDSLQADWVQRFRAEQNP